MSKKYKPLFDYLNQQCNDVITLTFEGIEKIIKAKLPFSARKYREWWANEKNDQAKLHTKTWQDAGYEVSKVEFNKKVVFVKI